MKILGVDMALANMGLVIASIDMDTYEVTPERLGLVTTQNESKKEVRKSSNELRRANELATALREWQGEVDIAVAEVPSGSQSASASRALGIAVGVLTALDVPLIEVSQKEVKLASVGSNTASKAEMIEWATGNHPHSDWLVRGSRYLNKNEHIADALASIYAAVQTQQFQMIAAYSRTR